MRSFGFCRNFRCDEKGKSRNTLSPSFQWWFLFQIRSENSQWFNEQVLQNIQNGLVYNNSRAAFLPTLARLLPNNEGSHIWQPLAPPNRIDQRHHVSKQVNSNLSNSTFSTELGFSCSFRPRAQLEGAYSIRLACTKYVALLLRGSRSLSLNLIIEAPVLYSSTLRDRTSIVFTYCTLGLPPR